MSFSSFSQRSFKRHNVGHFTFFTCQNCGNVFGYDHPPNGGKPTKNNITVLEDCGCGNPIQSVVTCWYCKEFWDCPTRDTLFWFSDKERAFKLCCEGMARKCDNFEVIVFD